MREDYSDDGDAWSYFSHDDARSRAYRWGEDGLAGQSDEHQRLCFALAFWNEQDPILKERLFGLTNSEGNHGEDVKEYYFFLDNLPTHAYQRWLYKYPQAAYPYADLVATNAARSRHEQEYELLDTGVFDGDRYFDIEVEYAKARSRGPPVPGHRAQPRRRRRADPRAADAVVPQHVVVPAVHHQAVTDHGRTVDGAGRPPRARARCTSTPTSGRRCCSATTRRTPPACGRRRTCRRTRRTASPTTSSTARRPSTRRARAPRWPPTSGSSSRPAGRRRRWCASTREAATSAVPRRCRRAVRRAAARRPTSSTTRSPRRPVDADAASVMRQALAGMLWSKQSYYFDVDVWLREHDAHPLRQPKRRGSRNEAWFHMVNHDVISMPDTWEYPWYAAWDLAFHCIPLAMVDPDFAKAQLDLMLSQVYLHPSGQLPAYEWNFGDVNPPVHAFATLFMHTVAGDLGDVDLPFLRQSFTRLLLNFTWWVNRKDPTGRNVFEGGFLGLDNIGVFDRSAPLPTGGRLEQADGTGWMALFSQNMLELALELLAHDDAYADFVVKFVEHFFWIAAAVDPVGDHPDEMWDDEDGFFYDVLRLPDGTGQRLKVRSMVGLLPLCASTVISAEMLERYPVLTRRIAAYLDRNRDLLANIADPFRPGVAGRRLLSMVNEDEAAADPRPHARRGSLPVAVRHPVALAQPPRRPVPVRRRRAGVPRRSTSRRSRPPGCSAATPTGAGRCGSRSTSSSSGRPDAALPLLRRRLHGSSARRVRATR